MLERVQDLCHHGAQNLGLHSGARSAYVAKNSASHRRQSDSKQDSNRRTSLTSSPVDKTLRGERWDRIARVLKLSLWELAQRADKLETAERRPTNEPLPTRPARRHIKIPDKA